MTGSPFYHGPDPELGAALRRALESGDREAFVGRVRAALEASHPGTWDVLAHWARRGIALAAVALVAGLLLGRVARPPAGLAETLATEVAGDTAAAALLAAAPPDPSIVFATFGEP